MSVFEFAALCEPSVEIDIYLNDEHVTTIDGGWPSHPIRAAEIKSIDVEEEGKKVRIEVEV